MAEIGGLKLKKYQLRLDMKSDLEEQINVRGAGRNEFHTNKILEALREPQEKVHIIGKANTAQ